MLLVLIFCFCSQFHLLMFVVSHTNFEVGTLRLGYHAVETGRALGRLAAGYLYSLGEMGRSRLHRGRCMQTLGEVSLRAGPFSSVLCPTQTFILVVSAGVLFIHTPLTLLFPFLCCSSLAHSSCGNLHCPSAGGCQRDRCSVKMYFLQLCPCG